MESASEKWKRGFSKLISGNVKHSVTSTISGGTDGTISNGMEIEAYYQRLKSKTSMKNLWSGKKFNDIVENDKTPDVSTESDESLDLKMSNTMKNLHQIRLDSDEDEMRINYIRENTFDENNNHMDHESSDESVNLMNNVHFAELEINEVNLSDDLKEDKPKDFLPLLYSTEFGDIAASDSKSFDSDNYRGLSKFHSSESALVKHLSNSMNEEIDKSNSIIDETVDDVDDALSEIQSIQSSYSKSASKGSSVPSRSRTSNSRSRQSKTHSSSGKSDSKKYSRHSKPTSRSSKRSCSSTASERTSTASDVKELTSDEDLLSDSSSSVSQREKSLSNRSKSDKSSKNSSLKSSVKSSRTESKKSREKHMGGRKETGIQDYKDVKTQTKKRVNIDKTDDVLNFRYDWQRREPSNIAAHVIDPVTIDVLTSYNPSVLAANDLMKYHMQLLQQHIQDSRRLYEAYANENLNNNYKYTTVEDTKKYIEKYTPKVISYEEALRNAKKEA